MRNFLLLALVIMAMPLTGCVSPAVLAGIAAAGSVAGTAHQFFQVGEDIVASTSTACQDVPAAEARSAGLVRRGVRSPAGHASLVSSVDALCGRVAPSTLDMGSPAWVGQMVAKLEASAP